MVNYIPLIVGKPGRVVPIALGMSSHYWSVEVRCVLVSTRLNEDGGDGMNIQSVVGSPEVLRMADGKSAAQTLQFFRHVIMTL